MVVLCHAQVVFDRVIGTARGKPVRPDTPFFTFSCTKAFTGMCIHKLIDEGKLELDAPVAGYWPEFGRKGKESATIRHVFLHQAGIPARGLYRQISLWPFYDLAVRSVANLEAEYEPGEKVAYHLVNYGWVLGEVVRRVTGVRIDRYFDQVFARPLGLEQTWMKLPSSQLKHSPRIYSGAEDQDIYARFFNFRPIRTALVPAASLHSAAREMAVFYQMVLNGGEYGGKRFVKEETIDQATAFGHQDWDDLTQRYTTRALGFHLGGSPPMPGEPGPVMGAGSTPRTFGHFGNRSCMAWADPDAGLVVVFLNNRFLGNIPARARWTDLSNAVWDAMM
jgi:CubicO group peptidase (beta-lactamase class C family)